MKTIAPRDAAFRAADTDEDQAGTPGPHAAVQPTPLLRGTQAMARLTRASDIPTSVDNPELVAQRRREIVEAAVPLFVEHGYAATRMRDIAANLNVNIATVYQYIRTKEDIFVLIYEVFYEEFCRFLAPDRFSDSWLNTVRDLFYAFIQLCEDYRHYLLVFYRETRYVSSALRQDIRASEQRNTDRFEDLLVAGVEAGEFGCDDPQFLAHMIVGMGQQWIFKRWVLSEPFGLRGYMDRAWDMVERIVQPRVPISALSFDDSGTGHAQGEGRRHARQGRGR